MENWKHIFDDFRSLLNAEEIKPTSQLNILSSLHPVINFTAEVSGNNSLFFDIMIHKDGNKIWRDVYSKSTDSKRYPFL